jgi:hypothetical protein
MLPAIDDTRRAQSVTHVVKRIVVGICALEVWSPRAKSHLLKLCLFLSNNPSAALVISIDLLAALTLSEPGKQADDFWHSFCQALSNCAESIAGPNSQVLRAVALQLTCMNSHKKLPIAASDLSDIHDATPRNNPTVLPVKPEASDQPPVKKSKKAHKATPE